MQCVELHAQRVVDRHGAEVGDLRAQRVHARDDPELRKQSENQHQTDEDVAQSEEMRNAFGDVAVGQRCGEKNKSGDDGDPMQLAERASDDVSREMRIGQNPRSEYGGRKHEGEEDQSADPDYERQQHEIAQERHVGEL